MNEDLLFRIQIFHPFLLSDFNGLIIFMSFQLNIYHLILLDSLYLSCLEVLSDHDQSLTLVFIPFANQSALSSFQFLYFDQE